MKIAIYTDTYCDANGVSRFLQDMSKEAAIKGEELYVVTSTLKPHCETMNNVYNLKPLIALTMPFYKELDIVLPPIIKLYRTTKRLDPDFIHISTPGTVGLSALIIAKILHKPTTGTYHTNFPAYLYNNTKSTTVEKITLAYMRFFYKGFEKIFTRSQEYLQVLSEDIRIAPQKLEVLKAGINIEKFNRSYRDNAIWEQYGLQTDSLKLLYVGRLSREKNFHFMMDVWEKFYRDYVGKGRINADFIVIGEGRLSKLAKKYHHSRMVLMGYKGKEELSTLYASSDLFVFPSETETLGQVVMEAQASGLPVIVADKGGQTEVISPTGGVVLSVDTPERWSEEIAKYFFDSALRRKMSDDAYRYMQDFSIHRSFDAYWDAHG